MTRGLVFSRALAAACSAAAAAACAAFWLHAHMGSAISRRQRLAADLEAGLAAQIAAKSEYEGEKLEALRDRVRRTRLLLGAEDTWDRLVRRFGERWTVESGPREERSGSSVQFGTFRLKSPVLADWTGIIETLGDSEALPGVGITGIEMRTSGGLERRSMDSVTVRVAVQMRRRSGSSNESR
jgi:hypothetical protein